MKYSKIYYIRKLLSLYDSLEQFYENASAYEMSFVFMKDDNINYLSEDISKKIDQIISSLEALKECM